MKILLAALATSAVCALSACSLHWPWTHRAQPAPVAVQEIMLEALGDTALIASSQYWERNTLLIDLGAAAGAGGLRLRPLARREWPIRLEFRVTPGRIGSLEVLGAQRMVFAVPAQGANAVLVLPPGVYTPQTKTIEVRWSAAGSAP